jgi:hypothetical protein
VKTLAEIAGLLGASEWDVFEEAYIREFGVSGEFEIEEAYSTYLRTGESPYWVTSYLYGFPEEIWGQTSSSSNRLARLVY